MSGRTTACAWLTAWAIDSSHSDHIGRTSETPGRVAAPGSDTTGVGDLIGLIAVDHRAPRLTPWPAPRNRQGAEIRRGVGAGGLRRTSELRKGSRRCEAMQPWPCSPTITFT